MPISALINGVSVAQINEDRVEYWHVELDAHDILLAEGLPAESYSIAATGPHSPMAANSSKLIPISCLNIGPKLACRSSRMGPKSRGPNKD